jgi:phage protein D
MITAAEIPFEVYKGQDFYVPAFRVLVRDQELNLPAYDVISVTYTEPENDIDSFDLTVSNWDPGPSGAQGRFKYSDGDMFTPWQDVELYMGYYRNGSDEMRRMLLGEIVTMTPSFPSGGASTLNVRGLNLLHRFRGKQRTATFTGKKDSEIAHQLVADIDKEVRQTIPGLHLQMDGDEVTRNLQSEQPIKTLEMSNEYPINFLYKRAKRIGYEMFVEEPAGGTGDRVVTVHYRRPDLVKKPTYQVEWGKTLISFDPSFQTAAQVDKVIVRGWDPLLAEKIEVIVTRSELLSEGILDPQQDLKTNRKAAERVEIVVDETVQSKAEAQIVARRRMRQIAQGMVQGRGKTVGLPYLRAGVKIRIMGLGRFSGYYQVISTTHTLNDSGYTTDFQARMERDV